MVYDWSSVGPFNCLSGNQCEPRSECFYRSSLIWFRTVCLYTEINHRRHVILQKVREWSMIGHLLVLLECLYSKQCGNGIMGKFCALLLTLPLLIMTKSCLLVLLNCLCSKQCVPRSHCSLSSRVYSKMRNCWIQVLIFTDHAQILTRCETNRHPKFVKEMPETKKMIL